MLKLELEVDKLFIYINVLCVEKLEDEQDKFHEKAKFQKFPEQFWKSRTFRDWGRLESSYMAIF